MSKKEFQGNMEDGTIGGAGYKMYLLENGLLGTILALIGYLLILKKAVDKRFVRFFLLLYIVAFLQRSWPTTHIWLYIFI